MPVDTPRELLEARSRAAEIAVRRAELLAGSFTRGSRLELQRIDRELGDLVGGVLGRFDPCDASPDVPLVLLPVRIETKLKPGTSTLRVRITPDEVHIDSLLRAISDDERAAGHAYWSTLWADSESPTAWGDLVSAVGARRAAWIAHATTPTNLDGRGAGSPDFPETPSEIAHGTVARCLPDQFIVRVFPRSGAPVTGRGGSIPRDLPISPIALGDDEIVDVSNLRIPAGSEWTVDFEQARAVGLGIEVQLPAGTTVLDHVVVVGVRRSVSEEQNAEDLLGLLTSHRFTDGLSLLAHGTPTNNADASRSPYQPSAVAGPPPTAVPTASSAATALATVLGIDPVGVEGLLEVGATRSTLEEAQNAANTALWFATWGPVLARIEDADVDGITPGRIESARRVHRDQLRAAGHAPTLRLGAQPYGVLPVTDLAAWRPRGGEITAPLVPLVERTLRRWIQRARTLPHIGPADDVSDADLLDMLGTSPTSIGVRVRPAVDGPMLSTLAAATGLPRSAVTAELTITRAMLSQYSLAAAKALLPPSLHDQSRTIALPLVSERDAEVIAEILADRSPAIDSVLQALLDVAWDEAKAAGRRVAPEAFVSPLLQLLGVQPDIAALVHSATATPAAAAPEPETVFRAAQQVRSVVQFDGQPSERLSLAAVEPVSEARTSLAQVALDLGDTPQARWVGQEAIAGVLEWFAIRGEVSRAMTALGAIPIDERRIAVASALDAASHRVDAWASAIAASRRISGPPAMTLGAFGYVTDVRLGVTGREPEGWIHAPSSTHAVAAGVLASAHRSKIGAKPGTEPFAIDLSSRRGVELRRVLEGVQAGQSIGALLGYQIERALTGSAARFQLSLRELAPLHTDELDNDLAEADRTSRVAAADVVDGVTLLRLFPLASLRVAGPPLRAKLAAKPANAYVAAWPPVTDPEWSTVVAALEGAAATLDAVSDALLAESVLQYASGNPARASAAMDAMASGSAVDPELGVLGVRQPGRTLTHAMFAAVPAAATGWSTTRPRAIAEPRLEAWAARRLGDPSAVIVADAGGARHTLADAGFAALDLVFADDLASLDRELRAAIPAMGEAPLAETPEPGWPDGSISIVAAATLAGALRTIVAGGTPVDAASLVRSGEAAQREVDVDELLGRCHTLLDALANVLAAGQPVVAAIDPDTRAVDETDVDAVRQAVAGLAAFGVPLVPDPQIPTDVGWAWGAWNAAAARLESARAFLAEVRAPHDPPRSTGELVDAATTVAEGVLGDGFRLLPLLAPLGPQDDFAQALTDPVFTQPRRAQVSAFVRDHASVRAGVARLAEAQLLGRATRRAIPLTVVQLTEREGSTAAPGTDRWLAGPLPDDVPWPAHSATHLVLELTAAPQEFAGSFAGITFDGWTETLPFQPDPRAFAEGADATSPLRAARATTGLAVHANQASARAPQVVLSAVSPDGQRWTTDSVVKVVLAALDLARARLVTLEKVPGDAAILPAVYVASPWLQARKGFFFSELAEVSWARVAYPFLSEVT